MTHRYNRITNNTAIRAILFMVMMLLGSKSSLAASSNYVLSVGYGSPMDMGSANDLWNQYGYRDQNLSFGVMDLNSNIGTPFNFVLDGTSYSQFQIYSSGVISLGSGTLSNNYNNTLSGANVPVIAPYWDAMWLTGGARGCYAPRISYITTGSAPNRVLTVEWYDIELPQFTEAHGTMQVRLYETSNVIEFYYQYMNTTNYCGNRYGSSGNTSGSIGLATGSTNFVSITPVKGSNAKKSIVSADDNVDLYNNPIDGSVMYTLTFVKPPNIQLSTSPKILDFGTQAVGSPVTQNVIVKHAGTEGTLTVSSATIVGNSDFTVVSLPAPLLPGQTGNLVIRFNATVNGPRSAVVNIVSNGLDSANQTVTLKGVGSAPLIGVDTNIRFKKTLTKMGSSRTETVIIKSIGTAPLTLTGYTITGIDADQYSVSGFPVIPIPSGGIDSLKVTYTPTREGQRAATLNILSNALNLPTLPIQLIGRATLPHIVVTPTRVQFDSVAQGDTVCKKFTVYNPGSDTLFIKNNLLTSGEGDFFVSRLFGTDTIIPPDKSRDITVCFAPRQSGVRAGRFVLFTNIIQTFEQPRRDTASSVTIDFSGSGVAYGVFSQSVVGGTNDSSLVGKQICRPDTIRNIGDADITIKSWAITGTQQSEFTVSGITLPYVLKARSSVAVNICATPGDKGSRNASLTISGTSNGRNLSLTAPLKVFGQNVCATPAPGSLFTDQKVVENSDSTMCVTVTNCGNVPATYTATLPNGADYALVAPTTSPVVAPGATTTFCVKFHPVAMGVSNGTLVISTANLSDISVPLAGVGACANVHADAPIIPPANAGGHTTFTVNIQNNGNYDWTPGTPVITPNDGIYTLGAIATIPAGGNIQPSIKYDPTDINKLYTAKITFPNAVPACAAALEINLSQSTGATAVRPVAEKDGFTLGQNYPNPFGSSTSFYYTTPTESDVNLILTDLTGKVVRTLASGRISTGSHLVSFDANELTSGTYIITLNSGAVSLTRSIILSK